MSWYYAENNERRGPIEDAAFQALVNAGTVKADTLVWRDGMANWLPFAEAGYTAPVPDGKAGGAAVPMGVCSESGRILPRSELIEIDGKLVSAEYKNVVLQRIREGVGASGASADPEVLEQQILARGYDLSIGSCITRGWALVKGHYWFLTGTTFVVYLVIIAAGIVPFGSLIVQGPLIGGLYWVILKLIRNQPAAMGDAFEGFSRRWGQLVMVTIVGTLILLPFVLPGVLAFVAASVGRKEPSPLGIFLGGSLVFVGFLFMAYFTVSWVFALPLVIDKSIDFWPAMRLSRRVVGLHWWKIAGLLFTVGMVVFGLMVIGMIVVALLIGISAAALGKDSGAAVVVPIITIFGMVAGLFSLLPFGFCALMIAYEEIFSRPEPR